MELISLQGLRLRSKIKQEFRQVLDDEKIACLWDLIVENARPRLMIYWRDWMVRANGAVVAQRFYTPLVGGSNPSSPTIFFFNESIQ